MKKIVQIWWRNKWTAILGGNAEYFRANGYKAREYSIENNGTIHLNGEFTVNANNQINLNSQ